MSINTSEISIGEIVALDFRAASIFKESGIDFCCGGKKSLMEACHEKNIKPETIEIQLKKLEAEALDPAHNFNEWELGFLSDYIMNTHHKYVLKSLPDLLFYTQKIASVHGEHHPELIAVAQSFAKIHDELLLHLDNEEKVLFPAIREVIRTQAFQAKAVIISEIERMQGEHEFAGGEMDRINVMTAGYFLPEGACATYALTFKLLQQFEDDLHIHVHLENNILYPKALKLAN